VLPIIASINYTLGSTALGALGSSSSSSSNLLYTFKGSYSYTSYIFIKSS
jgi:hypothetical protein